MNLTSVVSNRRRAIAWTVPVAAAAVVAGVALATSGPAYSSPHPTLPGRTAGQLLASAQKSVDTPLSGTVVSTARLGLPSLPAAGDSASLAWQSLVTGSHTALVWADGPQRQRLALTGTLAESDVIHNGRDLWTYTSQTNQATHTVSPADKPTTPAEPSYTPQAAAAAALKAIDPSTRVGIDLTQMVAGQKAYTLVLTPRDTRSTVQKVTIALDSVHYVPLRVQVFGTAKSPALEIGFTHISFTRPAASTFTFHLPAGATVTTDPFGLDSTERHPTTPATPNQAMTTRTLGSGWTSIVELPNGLPAGANGGLLDKVTTPVGTSGNRLITTALINALILKDGRVFVGAVTPALLETTAAATPR